MKLLHLLCLIDDWHRWWRDIDPSLAGVRDKLISNDCLHVNYYLFHDVQQLLLALLIRRLHERRDSLLQCARTIQLAHLSSDQEAREKY